MHVFQHPLSFKLVKLIFNRLNAFSSYSLGNRSRRITSGRFQLSSYVISAYSKHNESAVPCVTMTILRIPVLQDDLKSAKQEEEDTKQKMAGMLLWHLVK